MDNLRLIPVEKDCKQQFIVDIQEAFQLGYEQEYGAWEKTILPTKDIEDSFKTNGSEAYFAVIGDEIVGGTIIVINKETEHNHLDLLYVKVGCQSKGIGQVIQKAIEEIHPETKVWETHTPYYEKRNIHFYVNRCGFHIVEFNNPKHKDPRQKGEQVGGLPIDVGSCFFRFEKVMEQTASDSSVSLKK